MGLIQTDIPTDATATWTRHIIPLDPGILESVCCTDPTNWYTIAQCAVQASLERGQQSPHLAGAFFFSDYVYAGHSPSWSGIIETEIGDHLVLSWRSTAAHRITLNALIKPRVS